MAVDPIKLRIAQHSAKLFLTQMAASGVTVDVQLMAVELSAKTLMFEVKEPKRLQFMDAWLKSIRTDVVAGLKTKRAKTNGA